MKFKAITDFYLQKKLIKKGEKFEVFGEEAISIKERNLGKRTIGRSNTKMTPKKNRMIKTDKRR